MFSDIQEVAKPHKIFTSLILIKLDAGIPVILHVEEVPLL